MIVLTGATGGLGSQVLKHLLSLLPASEIIVSYSTASHPPTHLASTGVQLRHGDFAHPETLTAAFAGADALLLVSYPGIAHAQRVAMHTNAIDAAKRAGVRRVYYTSLAFASDSGAAVMQAHLETEAYLKQSGLVYTIMREGIYSESFPLYLGFFQPEKNESEIVVPGDGGVAWVAISDLGEGTARLIAQGGHENATVHLSGAKPYSLADVAAHASALLHRPLALRIVDPDEYVHIHRNASPKDDRKNPRGEESFLRSWALTYPALEHGELAVVDPLLQMLLGRELKPFEMTLKDIIGAAGGHTALKQYAK